jgi:hypothetical protein
VWRCADAFDLTRNCAAAPWPRRGARAPTAALGAPTVALGASAEQPAASQFPAGNRDRERFYVLACRASVKNARESSRNSECDLIVSIAVFI